MHCGACVRTCMSVCLVTCVDLSLSLLRWFGLLFCLAIPLLQL